MSFGSFDADTTGKKPISEINVTPLVDVMLVLLVIFIITAPLLTGSIVLRLPTTAAAQTAPIPPQPIVLSITKQGQVYWDNTAISEQQLQERLRSRAKQDPESQVRIRADEALPYGTIVRIMGYAQSAGLTQIGLVTQPTSNADPASTPN